MAAAMINAAVTKALYEVQLETLDNFKKYLMDKDDVDMEFMEELIDGFRAKLVAGYKPPKAVKGGKGKGKTGSDEEPKKKKAASAYTMYIQYQMAQLKKDNPDIKSGKELMAKAVAAWGELTDEVKDKLKQTLKADPTLTSEQLVTKVIAHISDVSSTGSVSGDEGVESGGESPAQSEKAVSVEKPARKPKAKKNGK